LATIDHQISQAPREPVRITKLKNCLAELEAKLDSQKLLVWIIKNCRSHRRYLYTLVLLCLNTICSFAI
jgi:hypothetical protein